MEKTKFLKKSGTFSVKKYAKQTMVLAGARAVAPAKRRPLIGATPPQTPSAEAKKTLATMAADVKLLERISAFSASCKVKKKKHEF